MNEMKPISNSKSKLYQVAIILLLAYAAISTAMRDLDRLQGVAGTVQTATTDGLGHLAKVYSATRSLANGAELAQEPQASSTSAASTSDALAAGGSIALAGFSEAADHESDNQLVARVHNKDACPLRKRELPKATSKDWNWDAVAQVPTQIDLKGTELLSHNINVDHDEEIARVVRRSPKLRSFINKLPLRPGKEQWSSVGEFKSLNDVIGFGFKAAARAEGPESGRRVERVERVDASEDGSKYLFEFKRSASDSERDELEMRQ
ncbi:MAG TPA: hypothetical protein VJS64_11395 [Pyrinomonadaceae bacterium]|nr:hypothetical protein [Pyrinomonadaceae bacterium]